MVIYNVCHQMEKNCYDNVYPNKPPITLPPYPQIKPLVCGSDHASKWSSDGYSTPGHWCAVGKQK